MEGLTVMEGNAPPSSKRLQWMGLIQGRHSFLSRIVNTLNFNEGRSALQLWIVFSYFLFFGRVMSLHVSVVPALALFTY